MNAAIRTLPIKIEIAVPRSRSAPLLAIALAALAAVLALDFVAPEYFTARGFPLDDAWIHAVYGRELARTGALAYNPGIPATGSTSPLWSAVLAGAHLLAGAPQPVVLLIKWIGFALHLLTALVLFAACGGSPPLTSMRLVGALLVAAHPDLISAGVSGMEVPLATLTAAGLVWTAARGSFWGYGILAAAAFLTRPELALVTVLLPLVAMVTDRRAARLLLAGGCGTGLAAAALMARNLAVSGLPLPATFYAKVGHGTDPLSALAMGFGRLLPELAIVPLTVVIGVLALAALAWRPNRDAPIGLAAATFASGLAYCAGSFLLITPGDPVAFYHQRYVLPALPLLLFPAALMAGAAFSAWLPNLARVANLAVGTFLAAGLLLHMPERYEHLANDAHNIDDVQVAIGRLLAGASAHDVVWAVDAGAVRYFGKPFVVDLMGLNTPGMLGATAQELLDAHPPRYLEIVPLWSQLDAGSARQLPRITYAPSTPYSVTGFAAMQTHHLVRCDPAVTGHIRVRGHTRSFTCAG